VGKQTSIQLPAELRNTLSRVAKASGMSLSDLVKFSVLAGWPLIYKDGKLTIPIEELSVGTRPEWSGPAPGQPPKVAPASRKR